MFRYTVILSLGLVVSIASAQRALSQEDIERTLTRAQSLYYEARFKDSVDLLLPVDAALRQQPDRMNLNISVKLQLALGYIGQNQTEDAKSVFQQVCILDPDYSLDSSQFAPKVLALFNEAKAEQKKARCEAFCGEIARLSKNGDAQGLLNLTRAAGAGCACAAATDAAEVLFKQGVDAYKRENFAEALDKLRGALKFSPEHDLAIEYAELAESKIKLTSEQLLLDWRKHFEAREFPQAANAYRQLEHTNIQGKADATLEQIRGEYRKVVASKIESWNQSCSTRTSAGLDTLRQQTSELLPDPAIAADLVSKLVPCVPEATVVPVVQDCLQMASQLAMVRLKTQVNPDIPPNRLPVGAVDIRAKVRIDESGNVSVKGVEGSNAYINGVMRDAVEKWKFLPAIVQDQVRCVDTEIPIRLSRS